MCVCVLLFVCCPPDATLEGSSMGDMSLAYSQEPEEVPRVVHVSEVRGADEGHAVISRRKRNILFPSGVKLCAQETTEQVVENHLSYFHLRGQTERLRRVDPVLHYCQIRETKPIFNEQHFFVRFKRSVLSSPAGFYSAKLKPSVWLYPHCEIYLFTGRSVCVICELTPQETSHVD